LNARHLRNVPGRKTDVADAAWIAQLVEHGLVRPWFVPPSRSASCGSSTRYRKALIHRAHPPRRSGSTSACKDAGIKLACVASDTLGVSGRLMLEALISGTTDPKILAELAKGRLRAKLPALGEACRAGLKPTTGCWPVRCWRGSITWTR